MPCLSVRYLELLASYGKQNYLKYIRFKCALNFVLLAISQPMLQFSEIDFVRQRVIKRFSVSAKTISSLPVIPGVPEISWAL